MIWLLVGYMWLFIHRPFEVWPWLGEYRIERVYMLVTFIYWLLFVSKTWMNYRSHIPVFLLAFTFYVASQTSPYADFQYVENWFKVFLFYILVVTTVRDENDLRLLVLGYVVCMGLYELHSLREYFNGRGVYRMGTWRMVGVDAAMNDPNSFGASVNIAMPLLFPAWTYARAKWQRAVILGMVVLAVTCILLTGSRSSFVVFLFAVFTAIMLSKHRWKALPLILVFMPLVWVSLPLDLQNRYLSVVDPERGVGAAQASAEGRAKSFWDGMESFAKNPLFGAGLGSYRAKTGFATHNLYNQAMGELGIFGLAVLLGFVWTFLANLVEALRFCPDRGDTKALFLYRVCAATSFSCLLLFCLGWGSHNLDRYNWLWFAAFSSLAITCLRNHSQTTVEACDNSLLSCSDHATTTTTVASQGTSVFSRANPNLAGLHRNRPAIIP